MAIDEKLSQLPNNTINNAAVDSLIAILNGVDSQLTIANLINAAFPGWVDYTSSSTIVGWASFTSQYIRYLRLGKLCCVNFDLDGVSNSTSASFTAPFTSANLGTGGGLNMDTSSGLVIDNGVQQADFARVYIGGNSNVVNLVKSGGTLNWAASGTKDIRGIFFFEII